MARGCVSIAGNFPFPDILRPAKSGSQQPPPALHCRLFTSSFSLLAFSLKLFVLCLKRRTASTPTLASKGNPLSCKIAHEFKDDFNNDSVRKGYQSIEGSKVSARQTAMT
jgi:hypothetical protein